MSSPISLVRSVRSGLSSASSKDIIRHTHRHVGHANADAAGLRHQWGNRGEESADQDRSSTARLGKAIRRLENRRRVRICV